LSSLTTGIDDTGFKMPLALLTPVAICAGFVGKWWQVAASVVYTMANWPPL
jgi:hypothetical protein